MAEGKKFGTSATGHSAPEHEVHGQVETTGRKGGTPQKGKSPSSELNSSFKSWAIPYTFQLNTFQNSLAVNDIPWRTN